MKKLFMGNKQLERWKFYKGGPATFLHPEGLEVVETDDGLTNINNVTPREKAIEELAIWIRDQQSRSEELLMELAKLENEGEWMELSMKFAKLENEREIVDLKSKGSEERFNGMLKGSIITQSELVDSEKMDLKERWMKAEERTSELLDLIQPNNQSQVYRTLVADYVKTLITQNSPTPCTVKIIGSEATKTYLPGGVIDLTVLCDEEKLKEPWYDEFRIILENEEKSATAKFSVKGIQYVPSEEVNLLKCTVGAIGINISVNLRSALVSYCMFERADRFRIERDHLLKRSLILVKAWCYYESQRLGDKHNLISPYALQTMTLYIFQVFDSNSFAGPLEVLCRFLDFYGNFDWENFCLSLAGPIPISSLPDMTAESPRNDSRELHLYDKELTDFYSSFSEFKQLCNRNWPETFTCKDFNVIDPLCSTNNLGLKVSTVDLSRIRSAFANGAKMLARLPYCEEEELISEVNCFFKNTWDRHGSGSRPDALNHDLSSLNLDDPLDGYKYLQKSLLS